MIYYQIVAELLYFPTPLLDFSTAQYQKRLTTTGMPEYLTWRVLSNEIKGVLTYSRKL